MSDRIYRKSIPIKAGTTQSEVFGKVVDYIEANTPWLTVWQKEQWGKSKKITAGSNLIITVSVDVESQ